MTREDVKGFNWKLFLEGLRTVMSVLALPILIGTLKIYTAFIILQAQYGSLAKEVSDLKVTVATNDSRSIKYIETEKSDRVIDVSNLRNEFVTFRSEYYQDFPVNYKKSLK